MLDPPGGAQDAAATDQGRELDAVGSGNDDAAELEAALGALEVDQVVVGEHLQRDGDAWTVPLPELQTTGGFRARLEVSLSDGLVLLRLPVVAPQELPHAADTDAALLLAVNDLAPRPGAQLRLAPSVGDRWEVVLRQSLPIEGIDGPTLSQSAQGLFNRLRDYRPALLDVVAGVRVRRSALRDQLLAAAAQPAPESPVRTEGRRRSRYLLGSLLLLVGLALVGWVVCPRTAVLGVGADDPTHARAPVPAGVVVAAHRLPPLETVIDAPFLSAASYRGRLDPKAPDGALWVVYGHDWQGQLVGGEAVDARTGEVVFNQTRLLGTGAYPYLWYGWPDVWVWEVGWGVTAATLLLMFVWSSRLPERLAEAAAADTLGWRLWAHARRLGWAAAFALLLFWVAALLLEVPSRTGDPALQILGWSVSVVIAVAWLYASLGLPSRTRDPQ